MILINNNHFSYKDINNSTNIINIKIIDNNLKIKNNLKFCLNYSNDNRIFKYNDILSYFNKKQKNEETRYPDYIYIILKIKKKN